MTVSLASPANGASISIPFKLDVKASVPLGKTETGKHHVHVYFDGHDTKYEKVYDNSWTIPANSPAVAGLTPGMHEMDISLRNADHSPAGAETKVNVMVTNAGAPAAPSTTDSGSSSSSGGGYGY